MSEIQEYAKLSPWRLSELGGFKVGDLVDVPSLGRCRVAALMPPSLVELQTKAGGRCTAGWRVIKKVSAPTPTGEGKNKAPNRHITDKETNKNG